VYKQRSKDWLSASKSAKHESASFRIFLYLRTFRKYFNFRVCDLRTQYFILFADL